MDKLLVKIEEIESKMSECDELMDGLAAELKSFQAEHRRLMKLKTQLDEVLGNEPTPVSVQ